MDVQKVSGLPAASAGLAQRPATQPAHDSGARTAPREPTHLHRALGLPHNVKLQLDIDPDTHTVIGRVIDKETGEVVRQIPSEEIIALRARSAEILALLDRKV